jgi:hypothetical protein
MMKKREKAFQQKLTHAQNMNFSSSSEVDKLALTVELK